MINSVWVSVRKSSICELGIMYNYHLKTQYIYSVLTTMLYFPW